MQELPAAPPEARGSRMRQALDALADGLLEHETLDEQEILDVTRLRPEPRNGVLSLPVAASTASELSKLK
jgi:hypothetical protein